MPNELEAEITDMLDDDFPIPIDEEGDEGEKSKGDSGSAEEIPKPVEGEGEEEKPTEKKEDEAPSTDPVAEGIPEGSEPAKEEGDEKKGEEEKGVTVPESVSEVDGLKAQISTLMGLLNTAHQNVGSPQPQVASTAPVQPVDFNTFMEGVDFDSVMETKEGFMKFFTQSMDIVRQQAEQSVMAAVPEYVSGQVQRNATMKNVADEFYSTYPELNQIKGYVANVASEVSTANPTWDITQVLTESARVTKEVLGLTGQPAVTPTVPNVPVAPTAPSPILSGGTRTTKTPVGKKSSLQSDIDDFLTD